MAEGRTSCSRRAVNQLSCEVTELINRTGIYEDHTNTDHIVDRLSQLVSQWVADMPRKQEDRSESGAGSHVRMFGGRAFGVATKGGDLDVVAIVPSFVHRPEFFTSFLSILKDEPQVTKIRPVAEAYVPILNFHYEQTEVDLCLCVTSLSCVPDDIDVLSDVIVDDEMSARSLSGIRDNAALLALVPDVSVFTAVLKVVKLWAKRRGLYNYSLGFLGGIAWSILVAKVLQLFPSKDVFTLLARFFRTFLEWKWPQPVLLRPLAENTRGLPQWNPQVNSADARHILPIITPAYPEHNAAFTSLPSTVCILHAELARGLEILNRIQQGTETWETLILPLEIEKQYKHFLVVSAAAASVDQLRSWAGLVEARIRLLTQNLERQEIVTLVHPGTTSRSSVHRQDCTETHVCRWLLGLELNASSGSHLSLAPEVQTFTDTVRKLALERHIFKPTMTLHVQHVKRKNISDYF